MILDTMTIKQIPVIAIAASGPGSGKTVAATAFAQNEGFAHIPFAAPIKLMIFAFLREYGLSTEEANHYVYNDKQSVIPRVGCSSRFLQQTLGTEWGRDLIHPLVWIEAWKWRVWEATRSGARGVVCDDLRFRNELDAVRSVGGLVLFVNRPCCAPPRPRWHHHVLPAWAYRFLPLRKPGHRSEGAIRISDADVVLVNNGTLEEYEALLRFTPAAVFEKLDNTISPNAFYQFAHKMIAHEMDAEVSRTIRAQQTQAA